MHHFKSAICNSVTSIPTSISPLKGVGGSQIYTFLENFSEFTFCTHVGAYPCPKTPLLSYSYFSIWVQNEFPVVTCLKPFLEFIDISIFRHLLGNSIFKILHFYILETIWGFALLHIIKMIYDCSYSRESFRLKVYGQT